MILTKEQLDGIEDSLDYLDTLAQEHIERNQRQLLRHIKALELQLKTIVIDARHQLNPLKEENKRLQDEGKQLREVMLEHQWVYDTDETQVPDGWVQCRYGCGGSGKFIGFMEDKTPSKRHPPHHKDDCPTMGE